MTVVTYPRHLNKTVLIALFVGTVLFCINQLDVVLRGDATTTVWVKAAVTYLVPFCAGTDGHGVLDQARTLLAERYGLSHATLQVEPDDNTGCDELAW